MHIEQLGHRDRHIRNRAALDLGRLADIRGVDALVRALTSEADPFVRETLTWALVRVGEVVVAPLMELLADPDPRARHAAAHVLSKIGDGRAVDALMAALRDGDEAVVAKAAFALGQIRDPRSVPALVGLLDTESRELQSVLLSVFERFGPSAMSALLESLNDPRWRVREQAAYMLGAVGSQDAVPGLIRALGDVEWQVRFAAAGALGDVGGDEARGAVRDVQKDPDERVRRLAARISSKRRRPNS
jgi:HEAT repeat protein